MSITAKAVCKAAKKKKRDKYVIPVGYISLRLFQLPTHDSILISMVPTQNGVQRAVETGAYPEPVQSTLGHQLIH
jgi:hypothetical protein